MIVRATTAFAGAISMHAGEVREIPKGVTLDDLLRAGYVVEVETDDKKRVNKKVVKRES